MLRPLRMEGPGKPGAARDGVAAHQVDGGVAAHRAFDG